MGIETNCKTTVVSVVVPIYNCEKYLKRCVNCLLKQTYPYCEIVLVDDGSEDKSGTLCEELAIESENITVIHQTNAGAARARQTGILNSTGKYIAFVDADDIVEEKYIENLVMPAIRYKADIIIAGLKNQKDISLISSLRKGYYNKQQLKSEVYPYMMSSAPFHTFGVSPSMCGKLFKKDIAKNNSETLSTGISFGEDGCFVYSSLLDADSVYVTYACNYIYVNNQESATHTFKKQLFLDTENLIEFYSKLSHNKRWEIGTQLDEYIAYVCKFTVVTALQAEKKFL